MPGLELSIDVETWPLKSAFVIARGAKTEAKVVAVTIKDGAITGRGECVPYARYGETVERCPVGARTRQANAGCLSSRGGPHRSAAPRARRAMRSVAHCGILRPSARAFAPRRSRGLKSCMHSRPATR